ncbi:MAG: hypothetical protein ACREDR_13540 [Blastocatellia bacterium]
MARPIYTAKVLTAATAVSFHWRIFKGSWLPSGRMAVGCFSFKRRWVVRVSHNEPIGLVNVAPREKSTLEACAHRKSA